MNPEFQRNLYLEISTARLIGMPAFLLVIFSLTYLMDKNSLDKVTANAAIGLYIALVLFWGAKQTAENIFDEIRNNTWDIQKTSAMSPWSLTWGKLFGSTVYNWYGGLLCLLVYSIATPKPEYTMQTWVYFISCGLLVQSLSLLVSLLSIRRKQAFNSGLNYLFALAALFFIVPVMLNIDKYYDDALYWYQEEYNRSYFNANSLIIACIWTIIGIYRLLAEELRIRTLPWVWIAFVVFLCVYFTGFLISFSKYSEYLQQNIVMSSVSVSFAVCIVLSYLLLFINENSPMLLRQLWVYIRQERWLRVCQEMPCWIISVVLALPAMVILSFLYPMEKFGNIYFYPLVIYLLMLRDIGILLYFSYAPNPKRAMGLTLLYMICLYVVLPAIFYSMKADVLAGAVFPVLNTNLMLSILFASVQTAVIGFLLFQRWQSRVADVRELSIEPLK